MELRRPDWLYALVLWFAVFSIPAATMSQPLSEYDTGWHIRTGQWIVEHGSVPTHDTFTTIGADKPLVAYSWLYGLGLCGLVDFLGLAGIYWYRTLMAMAVTAAIFRLVGRREPGLAPQAAITAAAGVALYPLLVSERPGLFSILFCAWTLEAILCLREGRPNWRTWLLPLVFAIWANLHIQFVHGLFLLALAWLAAVIDAILGLNSGVNPARAGSRCWWQLTLLGALCGLAMLANPYHVHLYEVVLTYARQTETHQLFEELQSPAFRQPADWALLGLLCAAAFALGRRGRFGSFEVLLLTAGAYFAFHARHDVWLLVLPACVILAGAPSKDSMPIALPSGRKMLALTAVVALVLALRHAAHGMSEDRLRAALAEEFPVAAAGYIEQSKLPGPIYNPIDWGGYLIWRLPEYQVGIDGRAQLHDGPRIKRFMDSWKGAPDWSSDPELARAGIVVLQRQAPLAGLLRLDRRFVLLHEDELAVVFGATR